MLVPAQILCKFPGLLVPQFPLTPLGRGECLSIAEPKAWQCRPHTGCLLVTHDTILYILITPKVNLVIVSTKGGR